MLRATEPSAALGHLFEDAVAMLLAIGEREEHVEERGRQRQALGRVALAGIHSVTRYVVTRRSVKPFGRLGGSWWSMLSPSNENDRPRGRLGEPSDFDVTG